MLEKSLTGTCNNNRFFFMLQKRPYNRILRNNANNLRHHFFRFRQLLKFSGKSGPVIRIDFKYLFMSTFAHHRSINRKVSTFGMSSDSEHSICMFRDFLQILYSSFLCRNYTCAEIKIFFPSYDRIIRSAKRDIGSAVLQNNFHCSKLLLSFRYNIIHIISYHTFSKSDRLRHFHHHKRSQADKRFIRLQFFHRMKFHKFFRQLFQSDSLLFCHCRNSIQIHI